MWNGNKNNPIKQDTRIKKDKRVMQYPAEIFRFNLEFMYNLASDKTRHPVTAETIIHNIIQEKEPKSASSNSRLS